MNKKLKILLGTAAILFSSISGAAIINVDFEGPDGTLGGTHTTYTSLGVVGTGNYWNSVGINGAASGSLIYEDGATTASSISISDTQTASYSQSSGSDLLKDRIIFGPEPASVTINNLGVGSVWDLYIYASYWDQYFSANNVGPEIATGNGYLEMNPENWIEGNQYVLLEDVIVDSLGLITIGIVDAENYSDNNPVGSDANTIAGFQLVSTSVPEPSIIALMVVGLAGLGFARRRKVKA